MMDLSEKMIFVCLNNRDKEDIKQTLLLFCTSQEIGEFMFFTIEEYDKIKKEQK